MHGVKARMRALMTMVLENWEREERGEPVSGIPLHAVFLGPPGACRSRRMWSRTVTPAIPSCTPGTGKTEMGKVLGRLLREWGFLSKGEFIYKTASDFMTNGVVGDATQRARKILESARGSVLMIDEAYALNPGGGAAAGGGSSGSSSAAASGAETVDAIMQVRGPSSLPVCIRRSPSPCLGGRCAASPLLPLPPSPLLSSPLLSCSPTTLTAAHTPWLTHSPSPSARARTAASSWPATRQRWTVS